MKHVSPEEYTDRCEIVTKWIEHRKNVIGTFGSLVVSEQMKMAALMTDNPWLGRVVSAMYKA